MTIQRRGIKSEGGAGRRPAGLTLVELILVIAILGVLAIGVGPRYDAYTQMEHGTVRRTIVSDLRYAQSQAIATRNRYGIVFNAAAETYTVFAGDPSTPAADFFKRGEPMIRSTGGVDLVGADFDGSNTVEFDAMGTPYNGAGGELAAAGEIVLNLSGQQDTIAVHPLTGKIEMSYHDPGGGSGCSGP